MMASRGRRPAPRARQSPTSRQRSGAPVKTSVAAPRQPATITRWVTPVLLAACCLFVLWQLQPALIFAPTTPTGGDLGAHLWGPAQLRDHLLPSLSGWSTEWFGGFPAYLVYMPVPALFVLATALVAPYGVALKVVVALSAVALPAAAWGFGRLSRLTQPTALLFSVASLIFLFDDSTFKFGGTIVSSLLGEYGYALGLLFGLVALGLLETVLARQVSLRWLASLMIALSILCHPVTGLMVVLGGCFLMVSHGVQSGWTPVRRALPVVLFGCGVTAFWVIPFTWYRGELNPLPYKLGNDMVHLLFPLPVWVNVLVLPLMAFGIVVAIRGREAVPIMIVGLGATCLLAVLTLPHLSFGSWERLQTLTWLAGRLLPIWHLAYLLLAALGIGKLLALASTSWRPALNVGTLGILALTLLSTAVVTGSLPGASHQVVATEQGYVAKTSWMLSPEVETNLVPQWAHDGFSGYERSPTWIEYHRLLGTMAGLGNRLGCGRALSEGDPSGRYGSLFDLTILPYWTNGCITSPFGFPEDASLTHSFAEQAQSLASLSVNVSSQPDVEFPGLNLAKAIRSMKFLGIHYFLAYSPQVVSAARTQPDLRAVARSGPWHIFSLRTSPLVVALSHEPIVVPASKPLAWLQIASSWVLHGGARPADAGPSSWPRAASPKTSDQSTALAKVNVSKVRVTRHSVSFHVDRIGVPIEVRFSAFPWWHATGADGPWRLAPNNIVVVPTAHQVTLTAGPRFVDRLSQFMTVVALIGLLAMGLRDRRRRVHEKTDRGGQ